MRLLHIAHLGPEEAEEEGTGELSLRPLLPSMPSGVRWEASQGHSPSLPLSEEPPAIKGLTFAICPVLPPVAQGARIQSWHIVIL